MLAKWNRRLIAISYILNLSPLGLPHIKEGRLWSMTKSTCKSEFHPYPVFSTRAQWRDQARISRRPVLSNKDQLKDLQNYLNQKMIAAISTVDGSTLGDDLIASHQVDYMFLALIPAEAVENEQEHRACHL